MNKKVFISTLAILILSIIHSFAGNKENYYKGWEAFNNNDREEARRYFELATKEPDSKTEAFLSLALLEWNDFNEIKAFENFRQFYESSENPYPYLYAMYSLLYTNSIRALPDKQLQFYEEIVKDPKMNGTLKSMIYGKLGDYYLEHNNIKKATEFYNKIGFIKEWQVLGTFDNISGSGFDKDWGAVEKIKTSDDFKNKVNADIKWYTPGVNKPDGWFHFFYYFNLDGAIMYAQSFVTSEKEQEVYIRVGTSGSLKIWLNDALISSIPEERNCDLDVYSYKAKLNVGSNRILVQIGQSEITEANFMLRLTDGNGHPIEGLRQSSEYQNYQKSTQENTNNILPFFPEEYFEKKIKEESDNLLYYIALAEIYLRNDKSYEGTHILKKAEKIAPKSSFIGYRLSETYLRAQNNIDYSREIENIKQNDPNSFIALRHMYDDATNSEKYSEAEEICDKIKKIYGESHLTDAMDIYIASVHKKTEDLITLAKKLYVKYPYEYEYMTLAFAVEENIYRNPKAAMKILESYCKKYFDTKAMEKLANKYMEMGKTEKGLTILKSRNSYLPYASGFLFSYAAMLQRMQRYNEALQTMEEVRKLAPYIADIYNTKGYIYKELKDQEKAKENFRKSIYYGPTSYDSRRQLRLLENKKEFFELFPKNDLNKLIANAPKPADYPEDNAVVILNDYQLVFYPEGAQEHRTEIAVKILNQSGIEEWKEYWIGYNSNNQKLILDKYEVIKANGQKIKSETDYRNRVVFTNLEVGDVLHLDYRLQDYYSGSLAKHFYTWSLMQYSIPVMYSRFALLVPQDKDFDYVVKNGEITPEISDIENMKLYQWIVNTPQPGIKSEPYMSTFTDIAPILIISSIPDWNFISNWYKDLTTNKIATHSDYILKETLAEILKGKEDASQMEKAKLFYEYILKNITYSNVSFLQSNFIPQKASRTITSRLGDCKDVSTLFVALCREVGINANLVLMQTRDNGKNITSLPTVGFNHCIARLNIEDQIYYLELTNNKLPFGAAIEIDLQSQILPIPYKNENIGSQLLLMDMPLRKTNEIIRNKNITIDGNNMELICKNISTGELASYYRSKFEDMGAEDRLKELNMTVSSQWNNPVKVSQLEFFNLNDLSDSVYCNYKNNATDALQDVAGMKLFKLPWTDAVTSLSIVAQDDRKYPFEFWEYVYADKESEHITLTLPEKKQFIETPENVKLECSVASYQLIFDTKTKNKITVTRTFKKKKDVLFPAEYEEFKNFISAVNQHDNKQYIIK